MRVIVRSWVLLGFALVVGCGSKTDPTAQTPAAKKPSIFVGKDPDFPVKVFADEVHVASFDGKEWAGVGNVKVERQGRQREKVYETYVFIWVERQPEKIKVLASHPEGWTESVASVTDGAIYFKKPETWKEQLVLADNRGGKAVELSIGEMPRPVPANWKGMLRFLTPLTAKNAVVRIDGKEIGTIWTEKPAETPTEIVVDFSGERSYVYREVYYGAPGTFAPAKPVEGELHGKYVHRVPMRINYFLEKAPQKTVGYEGDALKAVRETELLDLKDR